jgi:hypothetical protein
MQTYVKRGLQGGIKFAVDKSGSIAANAKTQYEPYYTQSSYQTTATTGATQTEELDASSGILTRGSDSGEKSRTGSSTTTSTDNAD